MKKIVCLLCILLTGLLTGCSLNNEITKQCVKENNGSINKVETYNITFKNNNVIKIEKIINYSSNYDVLLKIIMNSEKIQANNNSNDYIKYEINDNTVTINYDIKNMDLKNYPDLKEKYSDQVEYLKKLGYTCE